MKLHLMFALALVAGCDSGLDRWGVDPDDTDTDVGTGDTDTGDVDTDTEDIDTDTEEDTEPGQTGGPGPDCHPVDPIGTSGWSRTYATIFDGQTGTEVQTPVAGLSTAPNGQQGYELRSTITVPGGEPIAIKTWRTCSAGRALWLGDNMSGNGAMELFPGLPIPIPFNNTRRPQTPEPYITDFATLGIGGYVDYSYQLMITGGSGTGGLDSLFNIPNCTSQDAVDNDNDGVPDPDSNCIPVEGTITAFGQENVTVRGTTWSAYKIIDEKTERWSQAGGGGFGGIPGFDLGALFPGFGSSSDKTVVRQIWYVEGIGVVKELTFDIADTQNPLVSRELTTYSNLP